MSRVSGCLWLAVWLILALVAGGVAYVTLQRATVARAPAGPAAVTSVVVAARPVQAGALLAEADLTTQKLPADALPAGVVTNAADAAGQVTMIPLNVGEMVLTHHLTKPDFTGDNLGFTLPEGQVAFLLSADDLLSRSIAVQPGARVNILYSLEVELRDVAKGAAALGGEKRQYTFGALQGVEVVTVIRKGVTDKAQTPASGAVSSLAGASAYVFALDPQDALVLKFLRDAGAIMDLALRNVADQTEHDVQPVDLPFLFDKYQLPLR